MNWWDYVNPFTSVGNVAAAVVSDSWTALLLTLWNAGLWLLKLVLGIEDQFLTPDLSADGPMRGIYPYTLWIAGAFVVILLMVQVGIAAFRRDGQSLARVLIGSAQFVMVWAAGLAYAAAVLAAAGGLTHALMQSLLHVDTMSDWQPWAAFSSGDITDAAVATVLGVMGLLLIFAAFGHLLVMLTRAAVLLVLAATNPIAAAGLVWEGGRSWFWKAFRWFHAAAFTPVIMTLMLGVGVQVTTHVALGSTDSVTKAIGTAVPGVMLILVGSFTPLALFKLLAFVDPGTSSGSAMRAGLAAQGGLSGLARGGSGGDEGSSAAASSEPGGRSEGEAATESASSERAAQSAGKLAGAFGAVGQVAAAGLGMAASAGGRVAAIGADLTNQMGAGHNTYIPDFSSNRSRSGNGSGPSKVDQDNPQINGAGDDPPMPAVPSLPMPAGPAGGPSTGAGGGAGVAGEAGAAGSGAAGGAAAGAVPVVPV